MQSLKFNANAKVKLDTIIICTVHIKFTTVICHMFATDACLFGRNTTAASNVANMHC